MLDKLKLNSKSNLATLEFHYAFEIYSILNDVANIISILISFEIINNFTILKSIEKHFEFEFNKTNLNKLKIILLI